MCCLCVLKGGRMNNKYWWQTTTWKKTHHSWRRTWILRLVGTTPSTLAAQVLDTEVSPNCVHRTADELVLVCVATLLQVSTYVQEGLIVDDDAPVVHAAGVAVGAIRQF